MHDEFSLSRDSGGEWEHFRRDVTSVDLLLRSEFPTAGHSLIVDYHFNFWPGEIAGLSVIVSPGELGREMETCAASAFRAIGYRIEPDPPFDVSNTVPWDVATLTAHERIEMLHRVRSALEVARAEAAVEIDPSIRGGMPVIRGTRIGVYELADIAAHETVETILVSFPMLTTAMIESAKIYARAHPLKSGTARD